MAHKGRLYENMLRRDLSVLPAFIDRYPKYAVYSFDSMVVDNDPGANRQGKVSQPCVPFQTPNTFRYVWVYNGILLTTITIIVDIQITGPHWTEKITWTTFNTGTPGVATWQITAPILRSGYPPVLTMSVPFQIPIHRTGLQSTAWFANSGWNARPWRYTEGAP